MLAFRQFEAGPDPFGRTWQVLLKWMQTAISIRHSDTVDAKFILRGEDEEMMKTVAIPHADLLALSRNTGHELTDAWCSRLAAAHLRLMIVTWEDMDKDIVTVSSRELAAYAAELAGEDEAALGARG